jgi:predicted metal-dependent hydrolase
MKLTVRYPQIDFSKCFPRWTPNLEFSMVMNGFAVTPIYIEPFIVKVFNEAKKHLDPVRDAELIKEVEWFVAQESQHYRQHLRFIRVFQTPRYAKVDEMGKAYGADLEKFLKNKSLIFNLAYSEGFESGGGVFFRLWFEKLGKYRIGADEDALRLWDWHMAEEFEHREVAYKLYMAIAARGNIFRKIWYGYFYRIYGVLRLMTHGGMCSDAITKYLLEVERQDMSPEDAKASIARQKAIGRFLFWQTSKGLLAVLSPFYNPARKPKPEGLAEVLARFDRGGPYATAMPARTAEASA